MAIGLGRIFGFEFPENFNYPYTAKSITDFWRRWHITLSAWFREYVYIPLGGNRVGKARHILNILIVWGLTGFWHGAEWNFIIWGLYYGVILLIEKTFLLGVFEKIPSGNNIVVWDGNWGFDITLFEERSEPKWT
jgi:alginate O-acetyltransferase complex protein AlgI